MNTKYYAIVPAAGIGQRLNHDTPKQFLSVGHRAIIEYALQPFLDHPDIEQVVIPMTLPNPYWASLSLAEHAKIRVVEGGQTRADSVLAGLLHLSDVANDHDWILVHDAARPCLTLASLQKLMDTVADHEVGGLLATPVRDTLKRVDNQNFVQQTVSRDHLWQAQTPQQCRYGLLKAALLSAIEQDERVTDEAQALELLGHYPRVVEGALRNIKVTHPEDLLLIRQLLTTCEHEHEEGAQ